MMGTEISKKVLEPELFGTFLGRLAFPISLMTETAKLRKLITKRGTLEILIPLCCTTNPVRNRCRVEGIDQVSKGKLVTKYLYHHGYWDGLDREFRGFGRVDVRDTEFFEEYNNGDQSSTQVPREFFSPPTETRNWFHQGPILDEHSQWKEMDFSNEFWPEDTNVLRPTRSMNDFSNPLNSTLYFFLAVGYG
jgi:hypothetical protein